MAGKRLLDVAALLNASRGVAQKHIALRGRQLDVYSRTSTLAKAIRNQTERVTETAKAASILASRLNENPPAWASEAAEEQPPRRSEYGETIPKKDAAEGSTAQAQGLEQDHFYERSESNSVVDPKPRDDLEIKQEKADRYPLPDGTIPPAESDINIPAVDHDSFTKRPTEEPSQKPLEAAGFKPGPSGASSISTPTPSRIHTSPESARWTQQTFEAQIPSKTADALGQTSADPLKEGHDEDSFYRRTGHTSPTLSSLPRVKIPKIISNTQSASPDGLNSDSFYEAGGSQESSKMPSGEAVPEQEQIPEGINTDLFYSPRVARMLGGKPLPSKDNDLKLRGVKNAPLDPTDLAEGQDQASFNVRSSSQEAPTTSDVKLEPESAFLNNSTNEAEDLEKLTYDLAKESEQSSKVETPTATPYELRESKVPSSRLGRLWNYGGLAAGMFGGAISESIRRVSGGGGEGSFMLSASNMDRLVTKLSRMRGAALKLGQMMSFQDSKMLPVPIQEVLQRVQDRADYMPASQRNKVLTANLGPEWRDLFSEFDEKPLAAASIGQVHKAVLESNGARVAVKVQYPGVADSIDSDLNNLAILLTASRLLPKGLFLDKTIANARTELAWECDYIREAECGARFQSLLADETSVFTVPKVYPEASGAQVLTMEFMDGTGVTRVSSFTQPQRDRIGTEILRLCLREITEFRFMQTDPNWTNFLYNATTSKLELLDFGASREYPPHFIDLYCRNLVAASRSNRAAVREHSIALGYLTGRESGAMLEAHTASVLTLAEPFLDSSPEVYDFRDQTITERVKALIPVMIKERLAPPPEETYSLHRKLSGAFLLCARLGSRVPCRKLFRESMSKAGYL